MNANRRPDRSAVARGILTVEVVPHISSRYLVVFLLSLSVQCLPRTLLHCTYGSYPVGSVSRVQSGLKRSPFCLQSRNLSHLRPSFAGRPGSFARLRSLRIGENRSGGGWILPTRMLFLQGRYFRQPVALRLAPFRAVSIILAHFPTKKPKSPFSILLVFRVSRCVLFRIFLLVSNAVFGSRRARARTRPSKNTIADGRF